MARNSRAFCSVLFVCVFFSQIFKDADIQVRTQFQGRFFNPIPSLKLTAKAHENEWLKDESFPFGARPVFRGEGC